MTAAPMLSIVATLYRSEAYIEEFIARVSVCARETGLPYEIVLVNDGCPGQSLAIATEALANFSHLKLVDLSRNFGHHPAMLAGLAESSGQYIYLTNIDLEEQPENLRDLWRVFRERETAGVDVIYGTENSRQGSFVKRVLGGSFYPIFNFLSNVRLPKGQIVSRVMSRRYVDALLSFEERDVFLPALWELAGFVQEPLPVGRINHGRSTYSLGKRLALAVRAITSFSSKPLELVFYMGLCISLLSLVVIVTLVAKKLFFGGVLSGFTSIIVSLFFLNGLVIFSIGIIGIYLSRLYLEAKARPRHIVRSIRASAEKPQLKQISREG